MAKKGFEVVLDHKGIEQLLRDKGVAKDMERRGKRIAAAAGEGHSVTVESRRDRVGASVSTRSIAAKMREANRRSLSSAIRAGA